MAAFIYFEPRTRPIGSAGMTLPGCQLQFYISGTTTPTPIYANSDLSSTLPNPLFADATGYLPAIYLDSNITYRRQFYDQNGILLDDTDPAAIPPVTNPIVLVKPQATVQTSNTTVTPDPNLYSGILPVGNYSFQAVLGLQAAATGGNGGIVIITGAGTATISGFGAAIYFVNSVAGQGSSATVNTFTDTFPTLSGPPMTDFFTLNGAFTVTGPGTFGVSWAQNDSNANGTQVLGGSYLQIVPQTA